jgi:hypothetical protein
MLTLKTSNSNHELEINPIKSKSQKINKQNSQEKLA